MTLPRASGMKELPQPGCASTKMGSDLFSKAYDLGSQLIEGQWGALFVSLVCTSLLPDEQKAVLPLYSSQSHAPGT